jgi:hypothetical protein
LDNPVLFIPIFVNNLFYAKTSENDEENEKFNKNLLVNDAYFLKFTSLVSKEFEFESNKGIILKLQPNEIVLNLK